MSVPKNMAHSVHQRLQNEARRIGRPFNELLQFYTLERFLYRLSQSPHAGKFTLKGALMLRVWGAAAARPTMDIDLLGKTSNDLANVATIFRDVCQVPVDDDGLSFDPAWRGPLGGGPECRALAVCFWNHAALRE